MLLDLPVRSAGDISTWYEQFQYLWPWYVAGWIGAVGIGLASAMLAKKALQRIRSTWRQQMGVRLPQRLGYKEALNQMRGVVERQTIWQRLLDSTAKTWREAGVPLDPRLVWTGQATLVLLGAVFGILVLNNIPVGALLSIVGWMLPLQWVHAGTEQIRQAAQRDLIQAFHYFSTEFHESRHVARALEQAGRRLRTGMVRDTFERTARRLSAGEHSHAALQAMATDFGAHPYGVLFAQMCKLAVQDAAVASMFSELVVRMNERILLERRARSAMGVVRILSLILNALVLPAALAAIWIVPNAYAIFTETSQGQLVLLTVMVLMLLGFFVSRNANKVPDA